MLTFSILIVPRVGQCTCSHLPFTPKVITQYGCNPPRALHMALITSHELQISLLCLLGNTPIENYSRFWFIGFQAKQFRGTESRLMSRVSFSFNVSPSFRGIGFSNKTNVSQALYVSHVGSTLTNLRYPLQG